MSDQSAERIPQALSLVLALQKDSELEIARNQVWIDLAFRLESHIPASCRLFAEQHGWISGTKTTWKLPAFLRHLAEMTVKGDAIVETYSLQPSNEDQMLVHFLINTLDEFENELNELAHAWAGIVHISVSKSKIPALSGLLFVYFHADELRSKPLEPRALEPIVLP